MQWMNVTLTHLAPYIEVICLWNSAKVFYSSASTCSLRSIWPKPLVKDRPIHSVLQEGNKNALVRPLVLPHLTQPTACTKAQEEVSVPSSCQESTPIQNQRADPQFRKTGQLCLITSKRKTSAFYITEKIYLSLLGQQLYQQGHVLFNCCFLRHLYLKGKNLVILLSLLDLKIF